MTDTKHKFHEVNYKTIEGREVPFADGKEIKDSYALEAYLIYQLIKQAEIISPLKTKPSEKLIKIIVSLSNALDDTYKDELRLGEPVFNLDFYKDCFSHLMKYMREKTENGYILINEKFIYEFIKEYETHSISFLENFANELEKKLKAEQIDK